MRELRTTIHGNVTRAVTKNVYDDGSITAVIRLASTSRYFDPERKDYADRKTEYFTIYARRSLARNVLASVGKGDPLVVTGRLGLAEWVRDGVPGHTMTIQAESIGHDLTFGTASFERAPRRMDAPDTDERTGEVLEPVDDAETGDGAWAGLDAPNTGSGTSSDDSAREEELVGTSAPF